MSEQQTIALTPKKLEAIQKIVDEMNLIMGGKELIELIGNPQGSMLYYFITLIHRDAVYIEIKNTEELYLVIHTKDGQEHQFNPINQLQ